jgi:hypothetical protein
MMTNEDFSKQQLSHDVIPEGVFLFKTGSGIQLKIATH